MPQKAPEKAFQLLIFDWDGTLIDSIGSIVACTQAAVADLGLEPLDSQAIRETVGLGLQETVEALFPGAKADFLGELRDAYFQHWVARYAHEPLLFADVESTLQRLADAGYLLAIATGKSRRGLERDMDRVGLREFFADTRTVDEAPSKPHPGMVLDLLSGLGVTARQAAVVGDTSYDLLMAHAAGTVAVGVASGSMSCEQLALHGPLACLASVRQLPAWLEQRNGHGRREAPGVAHRPQTRR
jgi:phosphoglycolate phosphatase